MACPEASSRGRDSSTSHSCLSQTGTLHESALTPAAVSLRDRPPQLVGSFVGAAVASLHALMDESALCSWLQLPGSCQGDESRQPSTGRREALPAQGAGAALVERTSEMEPREAAGVLLELAEVLLETLLDHAQV